MNTSLIAEHRKIFQKHMSGICNSHDGKLQIPILWQNPLWVLIAISIVLIFPINVNLALLK